MSQRTFLVRQHRPNTPNIDSAPFQYFDDAVMNESTTQLRDCFDYGIYVRCGDNDSTDRSAFEPFRICSCRALTESFQSRPVSSQSIAFSTYLAGSLLFKHIRNRRLRRTIVTMPILALYPRIRQAVIFKQEMNSLKLRSGSRVIYNRLALQMERQLLLTPNMVFNDSNDLLAVLPETESLRGLGLGPHFDDGSVPFNRNNRLASLSTAMPDLCLALLNPNTTIPNLLDIIKQKLQSSGIFHTIPNRPGNWILSPQQKKFQHIGMCILLDRI